ncbi:MAG: replicative DNA helicase [Candidatus Firestonebacteria bacterium]
MNERIPPQNIEAEKSVLGSMLIEQEAVEKVIELLKESHFYRDAHRKLFNIIVTLYDTSQPVDIITVSEELKKKSQLEAVGGMEYITELINAVPTAANVGYYAHIVREKGALRDLINVATNIVGEAYQEESKVDELLDKAEHSIFEVSEKRVKQGFIKLKELVHNSMEKIEELTQRQTLVTGVATGFDRLDEMTTGFHGGELIIVAARPGMGKTSLMLSIAQHAAIVNKLPVAIFSLEMSSEQISMRLLCSEARVNLHRLRSGRLYKEDWPKLIMAASSLSEASIYIDDSSTINALEIKAKTRRLKADNKIGLVIVDYLQMMEGVKQSENRVQEISQISRSLKSLAKEMNVPVVVASQLSRMTERQDRSEKRPQLSHLRESGAIEQDADVVLMLYRESYYNREVENKAETEIIIGKQRNGPTGIVKVAFLEEYAKFDNIILNPSSIPQQLPPEAIPTEQNEV